MIGIHRSRYIHLPYKHNAADNHRHSDDRQIHAREIKTSHLDMLAPENISPKHPSKRSTESGGESTIVDANCHRVDRCPECPLCDGSAVVLVDSDPSLHNAAEENRSADVGSSKLCEEIWSALV